MESYYGHEYVKIKAKGSRTINAITDSNLGRVALAGYFGKKQPRRRRFLKFFARVRIIAFWRAA